MSASGKPVIPKTPQSSNKLKMLSAKKQRSVCSSSIFDDGVGNGSFSHKFDGKRRSKQVGSSVNSVNQSMTFDSNTTGVKINNYSSPGPVT